MNENFKLSKTSQNDLKSVCIVIRSVRAVTLKLFYVWPAPLNPWANVKFLPFLFVLCHSLSFILSLIIVEK